MRLATMTSLFRENREKAEHTSYIESMHRCKAAGFDVLDFNMCAMTRKKTELNGDDWEKVANDIRNEAERIGVEFSQSHLPYRGGSGLSFTTQEEEDFFDEMTRRGLIISNILGVKWAVVHPVTETISAEHDLEANINLNHRIFEKTIDLAMKLDVGIAYENMVDTHTKRRFTATADELIALIDSYHDPRIGACWDIGHGNRVYDNQIRPIKLLGKRIKALHVNDNFGSTDLHLLPFLGDVKWEAIMKVLTEIGYEGDFVYEIRMNNYMPDKLKDMSAKFAYDVGKYLLSLA